MQSALDKHRMELTNLKTINQALNHQIAAKNEADPKHVSFAESNSGQALEQLKKENKELRELVSKLKAEMADLKDELQQKMESTQ